MKRFGNLYEKIYSIENIRLAHQNARKGKKFYKEVKMVDANPELYLNKIYMMLRSKSFRNAKYVIFKRSFNGKEREIYKLPYFPDRIIHHCIMQVLEPIWSKILIRDTFSSIKGRGLHDGMKRVKQALKDKENTEYCLKLDIKKFYPSVNHAVLKKIIRRKIKCEDTLWLLDEIIDSTEGIPIGNYLSQYLGNIYLSGLDHYIKENHGIKYYFRYCDDMVILLKSKSQLWILFNAVKDYCSTLALSIKRNYQVFPVDDRGVDFIGYRFFHAFTLLRKSIATNFKNKIKKVRVGFRSMGKLKVVNGIMSYYGWIKYGDCRRLFRKYVGEDVQNIMELFCVLLKQKNPLKEALL